MAKISYEKKLIALLNPKRFRETNSSKDSYEYKNPFESDYFRVVTAAPIRRLQDKTQIFPQEKSDFVRRRLTHSIEVAAVGRRLGLMVEERLKQKRIITKNGEYVQNFSHSMAAILETAGLVHDIGNPPFGHFGEDTIQQYFKNLEQRDTFEKTLAAAQLKVVHQQDEKNNKKTTALSITKFLLNEQQEIGRVATEFARLKEAKNDFMRFDGNVQGFRILRHLGLSTDHNSFNLTMPTMATIIKYPFPSTQKEIKGNHSTEKFGYYQSEKEAYETICSTLHLQAGKRHPLAYLLEAADDIVNVTSDVEDGFKMGIIRKDEIENQMRNLRKRKLYFSSILHDEQKQAQNGNCFVDITDELLVKEFRIRAVHTLIEEAVDVFVKNIKDIINDCYIDDENSLRLTLANPILGNELLGGSKLRQALSSLQSKTYRDTYVLRSELLGEHIITEMLNKFIGCMFSDTLKEKVIKGQKKFILKHRTTDGKLYALISPNYKRAFDCNEDEVPIEPYQRFQLAVDHVSGMTDSYIVDLYNKLVNKKR